MRFIAFLISLVATFGTGNMTAAFADPNDDSIMRLRTGDPVMAAAVRAARAGLDGFLTLAANPPPNVTNFSLKVGLPLDDDNVEFVWVRPFRRQGGEFVGRLVNTPRDFPSLSYGQQIVFDDVNIIDWAYRDGDILKGHFTTCVLLRKMSTQQRTTFLADNKITCPPAPH